MAIYTGQGISQAAANAAVLTDDAEREREYYTLLARHQPLPVRSIRSGLQQLASGYHNTRAALNRAVGFDGTEQEAKADLAQAKAAGMRGYTPTFQEADSFGDYGAVAADWIFSNAPLIGATLASGGLAAESALATRGAQALARTASTASRATSAAQKTRAINAARQLAKVQQRAQTAGAAVPYGVASVGENYARIRHDPDAEGTPEQQARGALVGGAAQTALGLYGLDRVMRAAGRQLPLPAKVAAATLPEAATEAGEQMVQRVTHGLFNENVNLFDADARAEYLEAALAGGVVGGAYAGVFSAADNVGRRMAADDVRDKVRTERERTFGPPPPPDAAAGTSSPTPDAPPQTPGSGPSLDMPFTARPQSEGPDPFAALAGMSNEERQRAEENRRRVMFSDTGDVNVFEQDEMMYAMRALDEDEQASWETLTPDAHEAYLQLPYTGDARKRFLQLPPEERPAFAEQQRKLDEWQEALVANSLRHVREAESNPKRETGVRYTRPAEEELKDPGRMNLTSEQGEQLSLPSDTIDGRVFLDGVAIPQKRVWATLEKHDFDPTRPEAQRELFEVARAAQTYRAPTATTGETSEITVVTHSPRSAEKLRRKGVTSSSVYEDERLPFANFARVNSQMEQDFNALKADNPRSQARFQAPHVVRRKSNSDRERPIIDLVNSTLEQAFPGLDMRVHMGELEEDAQLNFSGTMTSEEQHSVGNRALMEHFAERGMQPIGRSDARWFFAPREAAKTIFDAFGVDYTVETTDGVNEYVPADLGALNSIGTIMKRPGRHVGTFTPTGADGQSLVAEGKTFDNDVSDGTLAISSNASERGWEQVTLIGRDAEGKLVAMKGSLRKPVAIASLAQFGQPAVEEEAVNTEMSFGKTYEGQPLEVFRLNENEDSDARMSAQAALAGMANPEEFIRTMSARASGKSAADRLTPAQRKLEAEGVPAGLLVGEQSNTKEAKSWELPVGARAKAIGTTLIPHSEGTQRGVLQQMLNTRIEALASEQGKTADQVKQELDDTFATQLSVDPDAVLPGAAMMPETAAKFAAKFKKETGRDLQVGDVIVLHREPAMPNASSMMPHVYLGEARWANETGQEVQRGIVVNSQESGTLSPMGADFDGDDFVAIHPAGMFRLRGYAGGESTKRLVQDKMLTAAQPGYAEKTGVGRLAEVIVRNMLGFSQRIGDIAVLGTKLREANVLTSTAGAAAHRRYATKLELDIAQAQGQEKADLEKLLEDHNALFEASPDKLVQQIENNIATIGQTSISAKKKSVLEKEAKELLKQVRELVAKARVRRYRVPAQVLTPERIAQFTPIYQTLLKKYRDTLDEVKRLAAEPVDPANQEAHDKTLEQARQRFFDAAEALYEQNASASGGHGSRIPLAALKSDAAKAKTVTKGMRFEMHQVSETSRDKDKSTYRGSYIVKSVEDRGDYLIISYGRNEKTRNPFTRVISKSTHTTVRDANKPNQQQFFMAFEPSMLTEANQLGTLPFLSEAINAIGHTGSRDFQEHLDETGKAYNRFDERKWKAQKLATVAKAILDAPMSALEAAWAEHALTVLENDKTLGYHLGEEFRMPPDLIGIGKLYANEIERPQALEQATNFNSTPLPENASPAAKANHVRQNRLSALGAKYDQITTWLDQVTKRYNNLGVELSELQDTKLSPEEEEQRLDVMDQRAQIKNAINTLYKLGQITDAQLLAYGPPRIVARMLTAERLQHMRKRVLEKFDAEALEEHGIDPTGSPRRVFHLVDNPDSGEGVFRLGDGEWGKHPGSVVPPGVYELDAQLNTVEQFMENGELYLNSTVTNAKGEVQKLQVKLVVPTSSHQRSAMLQHFFGLTGVEKIDSAPARTGQFRIQRAGGKEKLDTKAASSQYAVTRLKEETALDAFVPGVSVPRTSKQLGYDPNFLESIRDENFRAQVKTARDQLASHVIRSRMAPDIRRRLENRLADAYLAYLNKLYGKTIPFYQIAKSVFGPNLISRRGATANGPVLYLRSLPAGAKWDRGKNDVTAYKWNGITIEQTNDQIEISEGGVTVSGVYRVDLLEVYNAHLQGKLERKSGYAEGTAGSPHAALNPQQREMAAITTKILRQMSKLLKLPKIGLLSFDQAVDIAKGILNDAELNDLKVGRKIAFYDSSSNSIYINPQLFDATAGQAEARAHLAYVISHEIGHALTMKHLVKVKRSNPQLWDELMADYEQFVTDNGGIFGEQTGWLGVKKVVDVTDEATEQGVMRARVMKSVEDNWRVVGVGKYKIAGYRDNPERFADELNRLYSFDEYMADNIGRWLHEQTNPEKETDKFFAQLADLFRRIYQAAKEAFGFAPAPSVEKFVLHVIHSRTENIASQVISEIKEAVEERRQEKDQPRIFDKPIDEALAAWFNASKTHGLFRPGDMVEQLRQHINTNLSKVDRDLLARAAMTPANQRQMRQILARDLEAKRAIREADAAAAYLLAFHNLGLMKVGPRVKGIRRKIEKFFDDAATASRGEEEAEARTQALLRAFEQNIGSSSQLILNPDAPQMKTLKQNVMRALGKTVDGFRKVYNPILEYMSVRLQQTRNPYLIQIANMIDLQSWNADGQAATYEQRYRQETTRFLKELTPTIEPMIGDEALQERVWRTAMLRSEREAAKQAWETKQSNPDALYDKKKAEAYEHYLKSQQFLKRMLRYVRAGGTTVEALENYFPWIYNVHQIDKNRTELNEYVAREQFEGDWKKLQTVLIEQARESKDEKEVKRLEHYTWQQFATQFMARLGEEGVQKIDTSAAHNPGFQFQHGRALGFLMDGKNVTEADREFMLQFFVQSPPALMVKYVHSAVKRVEFERIFGTDGKKLKQLLRQAREAGATDQQIQTAIDGVDMLTGMYGGRTKAAINRLIMDMPLSREKKDKLVDESAGATHELVRSPTQWLITYENTRVLTTNIFVNFVDPFGASSRMGMDSFLAGQKEGFLRLFKRMTPEELQETAEWLDNIGTTERAATYDIVMQDYYNMDMDRIPKAINRWFFKLNGSELVTSWSREVTTHAANFYLKKLVRLAKAGGKKGQQALEELHKLDIDVNDVEFDAKGRLKIMTSAEQMAAEEADDQAALDLDFRRRDALHRLVNQSTPRPGPSNRSQILNDPNLILIGHLRSFTMAFNHSVLRRAQAEAYDNLNFMPLITMTVMFTSVMLVADWLRDWLKYGEEGAYWKRNWTWEDHVEYAMIRAGLYGRDELLFRPMESLFEGKIPKASAELLGVSAAHLHKIGQYGFTEADLPFQDLWRNWN